MFVSLYAFNKRCAINLNNIKFNKNDEADDAYVHFTSITRRNSPFNNSGISGNGIFRIKKLDAMLIRK